MITGEKSMDVMKKSRMAITLGVLGLSLGIWFHGLLNSPIMHPELLAEKRSAIIHLRDTTPDMQERRNLAQAYWTRYGDIRKDTFYGENGVNGILGAWKHYEQHGKHEGRIFGPIPEFANTEEEKVLAEAYWQRSPDIAASTVWGRESVLSFRGPRDHYHHVGRYQNRIWGTTEKQ